VGQFDAGRILPRFARQQMNMLGHSLKRVILSEAG
jgi:hypothetical protein